MIVDENKISNMIFTSGEIDVSDYINSIENNRHLMS